MDNGKLIVALLLIAIIFSVITLVVTMNSDVIVNPGNVQGETTDVGTASVVLEIVRSPSTGGGA